VIAFGVLLILVAVGAVTLALMAPAAMSPTIEVSAVGLTVLASPLAMFVGGAASVVLLLLGFGMVSRGTRHRARTRRELKELRKERVTPETTPAHETAGTAGTTGTPGESASHPREDGTAHRTEDSPGASMEAPPRRPADTE